MVVHGGRNRKGRKDTQNRLTGGVYCEKNVAALIE